MKKYLLALFVLCSMGSLSSVEPCSCGTTTRQMTLSIIKPDAVSSHHIGEICSRFEKEGLTIVAAKVERLSRQRAELFYQAHKERPFFSSLTEYMSSGPVFVMVLEGDDAVAKNRQIMGATNPSLASTGTLRALYGKNVEKNAVHGSDSLKSAKEEIAFFFTEGELESLR